MDKQEIYAYINELEEQMGQMYADLGELKVKIVSLIEENQRIHLENEQLRNLLQQEAKAKEKRPSLVPDHGKPVAGSGYDNLTRLYHEGFHICNVNYGHLRTEGDCLFCLSFLSK